MKERAEQNTCFRVLELTYKTWKTLVCLQTFFAFSQNAFAEKNFNYLSNGCGSVIPVVGKKYYSWGRYNFLDLYFRGGTVAPGSTAGEEICQRWSRTI